MEYIQGFVRVTVPEYLNQLPIPKSVLGFASLSAGEWLRLLPFVASIAGLGYLTARVVRISLYGSIVNLSQRKTDEKAVDAVDIEDLGDKAVFCRCWRSAKFPYCDGTHNKFNASTGDNVGPLIVKKTGGK